MSQPGFPSSSLRPIPLSPHPTFLLSPLFSYSCALSCAFLHSPKTQPFCFQAIPHSLPRTTRGGGTDDLPFKVFFSCFAAAPGILPACRAAPAFFQ